MSLARLANLFFTALAWSGPSFSTTYGSNPKATNGGQKSGAAAHKRAAKRRRKIRKNPRSAA